MIKSNRDLVEGIGSDMKNQSSNFSINNVQIASNTDVPVQSECVLNYNNTRKTLDELKEIMHRDADYIIDVASRFDEVDDQLADRLRG